MIAPIYVCFALVGAIVQGAAVFLMRARGWSFVSMVPLILAHQFLFTYAYTKAPNFILQWFVTAALTALGSFAMGLWLFGDRVTPMSVAGVALVFVGLALMKLG